MTEAVEATEATLDIDDQNAPTGEGHIPPKDRRRDRLLRIKSVVSRTGLSVATIYRRETHGSFPKREQIGLRCVAWYESDIDDFVANPLNYRSR